MARLGGSRSVARNMSMWSKRPYDALDGRLLEAQEEARIVSELTAHVGGSPTSTQRHLIKRLARRIIVTSIVERAVIVNGQLGDLQARQLVALWNSVDRGLEKLGLEDKAELPTSLKAYVGKAA